MNDFFQGIYSDRKVLVTGHTGFKGSWLIFWLKKLGAEVLGFSNGSPTKPCHFELLNYADSFSFHGDVRDLTAIKKALSEFKPEIVFHLAAQPLVRLSYKDPVETYDVNVMGTIKLLESCRNSDSVKAVVVVTSDKAYDNKEWVWGYRENDPMGGYDPYSSSKGCAELVVDAYRRSFFNLRDFGKSHHCLLASCRAGNVIGGGDWALDRLMTDIMVSVSQDKKVLIRNPYATRPWQHVLEPLSGYLSIGQKLLQGQKEFADAWNFGPSDEGSICVKEVVEKVRKHWTKIDYEISTSETQPHEANLLKLDCSKANIKLGWKPIWNSGTTFEKTVCWYKEYYENNKVLTEFDLHAYLQDAMKIKPSWVV